MAGIPGRRRFCGCWGGGGPITRFLTIASLSVPKTKASQIGRPCFFYFAEFYLGFELPASLVLEPLSFCCFLLSCFLALGVLVVLVWAAEAVCPPEAVCPEDAVLPLDPLCPDELLS